MITIIDYDIGNVGSIVNMLDYLGIKSNLTRSKNELLNAEKIILPGVGSFDAAISKLNDLGFSELIEQKVKYDKVPILGICLGMQLLLDSSEEGNSSGFGFIKGKSKKFEFDNLKVPHMGWNFVKEINSDTLLSNPISRFYFVHSYYVSLENQSDAWMTTNYGIDFVSAIRKGNIWGVQFHPEKSHVYGMNLLKEFNGFVYAK